jgi:hypothetical protein
MDDRLFILFARSTDWCLGTSPATSSNLIDIPLPADAAPVDVAAAVAAALQAAGHSGNPIAICIPSAWCSVGIDLHR